jgi:hypothetical protein
MDTARFRLRKTLEKLATNRSEIEGRTVTWAELLLEQAGLLPGRPGGPGEGGSDGTSGDGEGG